MFELLGMFSVRKFFRHIPMIHTSSDELIFVPVNPGTENMNKYFQIQFRTVKEFISLATLTESMTKL